MVRMIQSEWLKLRKSIVWMIVLISPGIAAGTGVFGFDGGGGETPFPWLAALSILSVVHAMLFLPLLTGVFAALICRYEHAGGGWKQLLALPVTRTQVYVVKYLYIAGLIAVTQLLFLGVMLIIGLFHGGGDAIPWKELFRSIGGGWIACLPLAALQLAVSTAWSSFAAPLAVNVIFTLPNMLIVNSDKYGPYYPWSQPMLAMMPQEETYGFGAFNLPVVTLFSVILSSLIVFFTAGWIYFAKKSF
jgi:lantibiotic transport system permease protein